jgi:serine/threonine protein kinase
MWNLSQVALLSRVRHKNLVELVGYSIENALMLVYEFMPGGSLADYLFGKPLAIRLYSKHLISS